MIGSVVGAFAATAALHQASTQCTQRTNSTLAVPTTAQYSILPPLFHIHCQTQQSPKRHGAFHRIEFAEGFLGVGSGEIFVNVEESGIVTVWNGGVVGCDLVVGGGIGEACSA